MATVPMRARAGKARLGTAAQEVDVRLFRRVDDEAELEEFADYELQEANKADSTVRNYVMQLNAVATQLDIPVTEVTLKHLRFTVKRDSDVAVSTRNLRITSYKEFHRWAGLEGKPWYDPQILALKRITEPRRLPKPPIGLMDASRLLDVAETPNEKRVAYLGLYAGLRIKESAFIRTSNVYSDRLIFIGKGDKERTVPIHPELSKVLPEILSESPKSEGVLENVMARLRDRNEIRDLRGKPATSHSLRRTAADFMYDKANVPREVVKMLLGHGTEVTDQYAPVRFGKMKQAIEVIDYTLGEPVQLVLW